MTLTPDKFSVTSAGLTTATTNYANNDTLGTIITVGSMAVGTGGFGYLRNLRVNDYADVLSAITIFVYRDTVTLAADNAAWAVSDADNDNMIDQLFIPMVDNGAGRQGSIRPNLMYDCAATSLFFALRADSISAAFFGAATDIRIRGWVDKIS